MATQGRRRALGQHFLRDTSISHKIAETALEEASRHSCQSLLEIGPGQGAITLPLIERLAVYSDIRRFLLVERDQRFAQQWKAHPLPSHFTSSSLHFHIETGDFLDVPEGVWLPTEGSLAVVSNLPYSAGTAILTRLAARFEKIPVMVLMFQLEVAARLRAEPSTKDRGSLSIWIQNRWDVKTLVAVPPRAFMPPPDVQSEVVVLTRRSEPRVEVTPELEDLWETFLKGTFAHRRKMLRSSFPWRNALELSGVDGTKRAEALQWEEWNSLFQAVRKVVKPSGA